jgi:hypothetical protein
VSAVTHIGSAPEVKTGENQGIFTLHRGNGHLEHSPALSMTCWLLRAGKRLR